MKLSTKIFIALFVLSLVPAIWLGTYFIADIVPTQTGFTFKFSALGITGLAFMILNTIFGSILYFRFLRSLSLSKALFFSIMPLTVVYGILIFLIADIAQFNGATANSIKVLLNITANNSYNTVLWAVLISVVYISALFLIFLIVTKPVSRMEKIINRLSDGKVKEPHFKLGGGKQFKELEHSLNKINYNFYSKDQAIKAGNNQIKKYVSKEFVKVLGKNSINELELGQQVKKQATTMLCDLNSQADSKDLSLEDNFNFISSYMNIVSPIIKRYGGFIDKYLGDGVLAVFSRADSALDCAHQIAKAIEVKNKNGKTLVESKISLHNGEVIFGMLGDEKSLAPTIVSDVLSFVQKENQINGLLGTRLIFTKNLLAELPTKYRLYYRYVGSMTDKSQGEQIKIYESLETYSKDKREKLIAMKGTFENGVRAYNDGDFKSAKSNLSEVLRYAPDDKPSYVYFNKASEKLETND